MGGKARHIGGNLYYIERGSILEIEGKKLLCFGGAESWDKEDRDEGINWWRAELPTSEELKTCADNLEATGWQVDYIITHCAPTSIALMGSRHNEADRLTDFLQEVRERAKYHYWLFGHYHDNRAIDEKHILLWEQIVQVI